MIFIFFVSKIKNLVAAVDFFGAFFFTILSFIAPILIYETNKTSTKKNYGRLALNIGIVMLGMTFGSISSYNSFLKMFREH